MATSTDPDAKRVVQVWFGEHRIGEYLAEPALAGRHEAAMKRRFPSLRVTNRPVRRQDSTS